MRRITTVRGTGRIALVITLIWLVSCTTGPQRPTPVPPDSEQALERWTDCFNGYLPAVRLQTMTPASAITDSIVACSGYQHDLVSLYPMKDQPSVNRQILRHAISTGVGRMLEHDESLTQVDVQFAEHSVRQALSEMPLVSWDLPY